MHSKNTAYRPDIDGLRAIAVLLVLLFHFDLGVPGGFIGVDIFFVISGFLITEVIRNAVANNRFSFLDFYSRRLLRLHPALLVTIAGCLGAGFLFMDPASLNSLAQSAQYSIFSASNFYFWLNQGYFDASAQMQPLLHTWSLAAEWQFYIVWPFIVWAALKISDRFLLRLLVAMTLASLVGSQIMLAYDSSAAYFMMPFRVFELSIGALIVFCVRHRVSARLESCITATGLILIVGSAFVLDASSPFPGVRALIPCLGAAACIYTGRSRAGSVLCSWPMVKIGLISYSVYLVHWPIVVFYKYYVFRDIMLLEKIMLLVVSVIAGALLYKTVERLFMTKWRHVKTIGLSAVAASVAVLAFGSMVVIDHKGMYSRVPASYRALVAEPESFHIQNYGGHGYELDTILGDKNGKKFAIMAGDSFALQYASGMDKELQDRGIFISGVFRHGCVLSSEYTRILNNVPRQDCKDAYRIALSEMKDNNLPFIYAQSWLGYKDGIADHNGANSQINGRPYSAVIEDLLSKTRNDIGDRKFIIIGSQPYMFGKMNIASCLLRPRYITQWCEKYLQYPLEASSTYEINQVLKKFAASHPNTLYLDISPAFCKNNKCETVRDGKILYSDGSHLSIDGSLIASKQILEDILRNRTL
ncbi:acyltransferase family protein [Pseudomonas sp.]|jgi:peptidoglycan/LPS O-acetylase OafA/YrhL|uniref:acyltransferase family protein n=1 Tax=Pseudomonas sp. TaxID=306 RepID=UPI002E321A21|nr:acyltransferase family protein [Pseudomonas sp.]HEX4550151.1 acyltransferase family protein [Pseudomonas sp.]